MTNPEKYLLVTLHAKILAVSDTIVKICVGNDIFELYAIPETIKIAKTKVDEVVDVSVLHIGGTPTRLLSFLKKDKQKFQKAVNDNYEDWHDVLKRLADNR